jgi:putative FmdB family regulatory protein
MSDTARRPTLHLKNPPARAQAPAPVIRWKCKPCGAPFEVSESLDDDEAVRCPACNARLGRADQFRSALAQTPGVRARRA